MKPILRSGGNLGQIGKPSADTTIHFDEEPILGYARASRGTLMGVSLTSILTADEQIRISSLEKENAQIRLRVAALERELEILRKSVVDLSPIVFYEVECEESTLILKEEIRFTVSLSEDRSLFIGSNDELTVRVWASSRAALAEKLKEEIAFIWIEYGRAADNELSDDAKKLKFMLNRILDERTHAEED